MVLWPRLFLPFPGIKTFRKKDTLTFYFAFFLITGSGAHQRVDLIVYAFEHVIDNARQLISKSLTEHADNHHDYGDD